jgi:hypothetical protein
METAVRIATAFDGTYRAWRLPLPGCAVYGRSPPSERKSGATPVGRMERNPQQ